MNDAARTQMAAAGSGKVVTYLEVTGLGLFAPAPSAPRQFRKSVLRVGTWKHPATGETIDITPAKLDRIVANTKRWLELGHKVHFPNGHTDDAMKNLGWWLSIDRQGDEALAVLEIPTHAKAELDRPFSEIASRIGTTIKDVSPGIWWDAVSSATGEKFEGGVLEHICATPVPVMHDQSNFVPLARTKKEETKMLVIKLDRATLSKAPAAGASVADAIKGFLGVPAETTDADLVEGLRGFLAESTAEKPAPEGAAKLSREELDRANGELAKVKAELSAERDSRAKELVKRAEERVVEAKTASVKLGRPIEDEKLSRVKALLSRPETEAQGSELLAAYLDAAGAKRSASSTTLSHPDAAAADDARLARHSHLSRGFESQGLKVEKDAKGFIKRVNGKDFTG